MAGVSWRSLRKKRYPCGCERSESRYKEQEMSSQIPHASSGTIRVLRFLSMNHSAASKVRSEDK